MECYSIIEKNEIRPLAARKTDPEAVILREVKPDRQKGKYQIIWLVSEIWKEKTHMNLFTKYK